MRLAFLVLAITAPAAAQTADEFFASDVVHEIRLDIHPSDWQSLIDNYLSNTYYPCDFRWRGVVIDNIGIRSRGLGSRSPTKPGLRVDFDRFEEDQKFLGLRSFHLKNVVQDPSMLRERLAMSFIRRFDLPAPREAHARLFVNGAYAGLFLIVESIDKVFVKRHFNEDDGFLYKYEYANPYRFEYLGADPARYSPSPFEPVTHERDPNPAPLERMIRAINQTSDADFARVMAEFLDLKQFMAYLAAEMFLTEVDGLLSDNGMANFYLYRFVGKDLSQFLAWDRDRTFGDPSRSVMQNAQANVLVRRCLAVPELRTAYFDALLRAAALAGGSGGWLEQQIEGQFSQIAAAARADTLKPWSNAEFEADVERNLKRFARERADFVRREVAQAGSLQSGGPRLSEGGAVNAAGGAPLLAPGAYASLFGENLAGALEQATAAPLPTTLGGVSVFINGFAAPVLFVSPAQVNVQVPWETPTGQAPVVVLVKGVPIGSIQARIAAAAPGVFAVVHADGGVISAARPVAAGNALVIFANGLGPVSSPPLTGSPAPTDRLAATLETPAVRLANLSADVLFSGLAPGFVGLYQLNVVAPAGLVAGTNTPLVIVAAGQSSPAVPLPTR